MNLPRSSEVDLAETRSLKAPEVGQYASNADIDLACGLDQVLAGIGVSMSEEDIQKELSTQDENCECKKGMRPQVDRRQLLRGSVAALAGGGALVAASNAALADTAGARKWPVPSDPTKEQGRMMGEDRGYGLRSQFETETRWWAKTRTTSYTPLAKQQGIITPSGLHFERHHAGIPEIDPAKHSLVIHGHVQRPMKYTVEDIKRFPSISRIHFIECAGSTGSQFSKIGAKDVQRTHGLLSTSEWTGVSVSTLLKQVGLKDGAAWVLAEGADAAMMTRSIPLDKMLDNAFVAYAQNGESIRPEQGYPLKLLLPGWEGNTHIKWLRRLHVSDKPFMTREETSKYTDILTKTGKSRIFTFTMEAKSVIAFPSGEMKLPRPGFYEITGTAWSGRGKIRHVEITTDGGKSWSLASLQDPIHSISQTRFRFPWVWDGKPTVIASRATDETGYMQPTHAQLKEARGLLAAGVTYHMNAIQHWGIKEDGEVYHWHPFVHG